MFAVHLPSLLHKSDSDISEYAGRMKREFEEVESERNLSRSLVVGDFNLNPFSRGMVSFYGFHAVMCKKTACKKSRKLDGEVGKYYYNPMWALMGNRDNEVLGSFSITRRLQVLFGIHLIK